MLQDKATTLRILKLLVFLNFSSSSVCVVARTDVLQAVSELGFALNFDLSLGLLYVFPSFSWNQGLPASCLLFTHKRSTAPLVPLKISTKNKQVDSSADISLTWEVWYGQPNTNGEEKHLVIHDYISTKCDQVSVHAYL